MRNSLAVILASMCLVNISARAATMTSTSSGQTLISCETAATASQAAAKLNQNSQYAIYAYVSAPSIVIANNGEVTMCVTQTHR